MRAACAILFPALLSVGCHGRRALAPVDASAAEVSVPDGGAPETDAGGPDTTDGARDGTVDGGADGSGDASQDSVGGVPTYRVQLVPAPLPNGAQVPEQELTLSLIPETAGMPAFVLVSVPGVTARVEAARVGDGAYATRAPVSLPSPMFADPCMPARYVLSSLEVTVDADSLTGQAQGTFEIDEGDVLSSRKLTATLTGVPATEAPTVVLTGFDPPTFQGGVSPLGRLHFVASRPLQPGTVAALLGSDGTTTTLAPDVAVPGAMVGFSTGGGALTKFGATYDLVVRPTLVDLAGNVGQPAVHVVTAADPGLVAFDGFEGPVAAVGSAKLVFTDGLELPPISGQRSLVLVPSTSGDATVVMRATVPSPNATLRLGFRGEAETPGSRDGTLQVTVAAPGGAATTGSFPAWAAGDSSEIVSTSRGSKELGPVKDVAIALPADATGEVFIELRLPHFCDIPGETAPLILVDDLRIE